MKKLLPVFFFLCLIAPFAVGFLWLQHERHLVRREVKHQLVAQVNKEELVLLKFTEEQAQKINWKHSREFEFEGWMYDIVQQENRGDTTYYWCWWDYKETRLNKQLDHLLVRALQQNPVNRENQERLVKFIKTVHQNPPVYLSNHFCPEDSEKRGFKRSMYKSLHFTPPAPPPWITMARA